MEHAAGVQLHQRWPSMAGDQQIRCIDAIYQKLKEMVDIEFSAYGSLYFVDSPLDSATTQPLGQGFCIGPHCGPIFWNCNTGAHKYYHKIKPNQGPCKFSSLLFALALTKSSQSIQGVTLLHSVMALLIPVFPGFHPSIRYRTGHTIMDQLIHIIISWIPDALFSRKWLVTLGSRMRLAQRCFTQTYTRGIYSFQMKILPSSQLSSIGSRRLLSQRSGTQTKCRTLHALLLSPRLRTKLIPTASDVQRPSTSALNILCQSCLAPD